MICISSRAVTYIEGVGRFDAGNRLAIVILTRSQFVFEHQIAIAVTVFAHVATLPFLPYREVKAVGGVIITTSIKRRLSKAERENRGKLLKLATGIKDAVMRGDRAAAGAMLRGAKAAAFTPRIYQAHPRWRLSLPEFPVGLPKCPSSPQKISRFDFTGNFGQNPWNVALLTAAKNR
jgi:hypothetical protein